MSNEYTWQKHKEVFNSIAKIECGKDLSLRIPEIDDIIEKNIMKEFNLTNKYQVPRFDKIVVSIGPNSKSTVSLKDVAEYVTLITGQKPVVTLAKKSKAQYKIRAGMPVGVKVSLTGSNMRNFFYKFKYCMLNELQLPVFSAKSINQTKNGCQLNIGLRHIGLFAEMPYLSSQKIGCTITIVSKCGTKTPQDKKLFERFLYYLGLPMRNTIEGQGEN